MPRQVLAAAVWTVLTLAAPTVGAQQAKPKPAATPPKAAPAKAPVNPAAPVGIDQLGSRLATLLHKHDGTGTWGILVYSLTKGDTLYNYRADDQLQPASTMKLFTSALALDRFGADGRFETAVLRVGTVRPDSVLEGDLVLRGAGDPTLSGSIHDLDEEPAMPALARQVAAAGIKRVTGSIIGDPSAFDGAKVPEGWLARYLSRSYAARVSALSFNQNRVGVVVEPEGKKANIYFDPVVSGVPFTNNVKVVAGSRGSRLSVAQDTTLNQLEISGWIGSLSHPRTVQTVVENPELFAAGALRAALAAQGIMSDGGVRVGRTPDSAVVVTALPSPTLDRIVQQMNGESNNHYAELLFRNAAHTTGAPGSAETGNVLLRRFMYEKVNIPPTSVFAADGSGLSTLDRITARALVQLLEYARRAPWGQVLEHSLPVAGVSETLARRMRRTAATGNLHAKTGTTDDVASLGGYVTAKNGEELAFAFIYNGRDMWRARSTIDAMGVSLARFSR